MSVLEILRPDFRKQRDKPKIRVLLGVPCYRYMPAQTCRFITAMILHVARHRPEIELNTYFTDEMPVAECLHCSLEGKQDNGARNRMAETAIKENCDYLVMVDSDMDFGTGSDGSLLAKLLDQDRDIIAPLFIRRSAPYDLMAKRYLKEAGGYVSIAPEEAATMDTIEVHGVGFGMVAIKVDLLRRLPKPHFVFEMVNGVWTAEDLNFCSKARKQGFKVWCDTSILIDHLGGHRYRPQDGVVVEQRRRERDAQERRVRAA